MKLCYECSNPSYYCNIITHKLQSTHGEELTSVECSLCDNALCNQTSVLKLMSFSLLVCAICTLHALLIVVLKL